MGGGGVKFLQAKISGYYNNISMAAHVQTMHTLLTCILIFFTTARESAAPLNYIDHTIQDMTVCFADGLNYNFH